MWWAHFAHFLAVAYFLGFLALDSLVVRAFLNDECKTKKIAFYEKAKRSLYIAAAIMAFSGVWMLKKYDFSPPAIIWLKIFLVLSSLALFFTAPHILKRFRQNKVGYWYGVVTALALAGALIGRANF